MGKNYLNRSIFVEQIMKITVTFCVSHEYRGIRSPTLNVMWSAQMQYNLGLM